MKPTSGRVQTTTSWAVRPRALGARSTAQTSTTSSHMGRRSASTVPTMATASAAWTPTTRSARWSVRWAQAPASTATVKAASVSPLQ